MIEKKTPLGEISLPTDKPTTKSDVPLHYQFDDAEHKILHTVLQELSTRYTDRNELLALACCYLDDMQIKSELYYDLLNYILDNLSKETPIT